MKLRLAALALACTFTAASAHVVAAPRHNVLIFVADGLRYDSVTPKSAPTLWRIKKQGVDFANSHALYPTITTVNASAIATGHYIGDTGNFGNALYAGFGAPPMVVGMEDDQALGAMNEHFSGNYLHETSLIAAAREAGFATAIVGKVGPTAIQDITQRDGTGTIVIDDAIGTPKGIAVAADIDAAIKAAGLSPIAPKTNAPNDAQEQYLADVATKVVLPRLAHSAKPFAMLFWSRDPDATQHVQHDGNINGPTSRAGIKDADSALAGLLAWLRKNRLDRTTDVFVTADHGFSTIAEHAPSGFLGAALKRFPGVLVVPNGGSDLIYIQGTTSAATLVDALTKLDYVSGIFVDDALGNIPGSLPMSAIGWRGAALTPRPSIVVSFASHLMPGCAPKLMCAAEVADTSLAEGQGMHGSFSRADTRNFMAAIGPDFKARFVDKVPVSNADINPTLARILGVKIQPKGALTGRAASEALKGRKTAVFSRGRQVSAPAANGEATILEYQRVGDTRYFDAAGFPGRTVGLPDR